MSAWSVHALTASGAVWGILALKAAAVGDFRVSFAWLGLAFVVDGIDGPLARRFRVKATLPEFDGAALDQVVDYLTYVVVPAFLIGSADLLPATLRWLLPAAVCLVSAYQFALSGSKFADGSFRGFPSCWNVVALYLIALELPRWLSALVILALCVLVFVPMTFLHPARTRRFRGLTLSLTGLWALSLVVVGIGLEETRPAWLALSIAYVAYYAALSLWITARKRA